MGAQATRPGGWCSSFFSICIIYTLTLERPLVFGVIQKNGILSNEDLFFWRALFLIFTLSLGDHFNIPHWMRGLRLVWFKRIQKVDHLGRCSQWSPGREGSPPSLCSRYSVCSACSACAFSHVRCRHWVGIWSDPRIFGSKLVTDTK